MERRHVTVHRQEEKVIGGHENDVPCPFPTSRGDSTTSVSRVKLGCFDPVLTDHVCGESCLREKRLTEVVLRLRLSLLSSGGPYRSLTVFRPRVGTIRHNKGCRFSTSVVS